MASVTLLGIVVPVDAARHTRRETNAQRFERSLGPLPPLKRSRTDSAWRLSFLRKIVPILLIGLISLAAKRGQISQRQT